MEYRSLGAHGPKVSAIALGSASFGGTSEYATRDQKTVDAVVGVALDAGVNLFDTAALYSGGRSEEMLGEALRGKRHKALIATKYREFGPWTKEDILARLRESLKRLATDHIDLFQMHWPKNDMTTEDADIMADAFEQAIRDGLTRFVGVSNFRINHLRLLSKRARTLLVSNQVPYNLLDRFYDTEGATEFCARHGISYIAYSPSAHGMLSGAYGPENRPTSGPLAESPWTHADVYPETVKVIEEVMAVARECHRPPVQVALQWVISRKIVASAIVGTRNVEHLTQDLGALEWKLDPALARRLDRAGLSCQQFLDKSPAKL